MKVKVNILLAIVYSSIVIYFGFWWSNHFSKHCVSKGDESFFEIEIIGFISFLLSITYKIINRKLKWLHILVLPLLTAIISIVFTMFFPITTLVTGTTTDNLWLYGIIHSIIFILVIYFQLRIVYKKTSYL